MKKLKMLYEKLMKILFILIVISLLISFGTTTSFNANAFVSNGDSKNNNILFYENEILRNNYFILLEKLKKIEDQLTEINKYDSELYSQILGFSTDSIKFNYNDTMNIKSVVFDSILKHVDHRMLKLSEHTSNQLDKLIEMHRVVNDENYLNQYPNISPIKIIDFISITSPFGWREHPIYKTQLFHTGIDISANVNTKVYSTIDGVVTKIVYSKYGYGNKITIKNSLGYEILFAHLGAKIYVKTGEMVKKNQLIARTGNTGTSTGPHLHYEIRKNGQLDDPLKYFYTYLSDELIALN